MIERPLIWIELNIKNMASSYIFEGNQADDDGKGNIFLDLKSSSCVSVLETFKKGHSESLDIRLGKNHVTVLKFEAKIKEKNESNQVNFDIPAIFLPRYDWVQNLIQDDAFDGTCDMPSFIHIKKYIEIYKQFQNLRFMLQDNDLAIEGSLEETSMRTYFTKLETNENQADGDKTKHRDMSMYEVQIGSKSFVGFLNSILAMNFYDVEIKCSVSHHKLLLLSFIVPGKDIIFNFILEHIEGDDYDDDYFETQKAKKRARIIEDDSDDNY
jgi:formylmethanofuran dehydrogenase subunit D